MREWLEDWLVDSLADDGIRDDSEFYDYIGHIRTVCASLDNIQNTLASSPAFFKKTLSEAIEIAEQVHEFRSNHFQFLVSTDSVVEVNATLNGKDHLKDIYQLDDKVMHLTTEIENLINSNKTIQAASNITELKYNLRRLQSIDGYLLSRAERKVSEMERGIESDDEDDIDYEILANPPEPSRTIPYQAFSHPSMGIPQVPVVNPKIQAPVINSETRATNDYNFLAHNTPNKYEINSSAPNNTPTRTERYYGELKGHVPVTVERYYYNDPSYKPQMKQCGYNRQSVRERKRTIDKKKVGALVLAASLCVGGVALYNQQKEDAVKDAPTTNPITYTETIQTSYTPPVETITPVQTTQPIVDTPEIAQETNVTTTTQPAKETTAPAKKYSKGSLAYSVQSLDDEMISVIAKSLKNSMKGRNGNQIAGYANGVNQTFDTDREYVEYVFNILDSCARNLKVSDISDRFAIAPQMEELSGDVSKYLIAKALNESGKYNRTNYTASDIDFYWTIYGGKTNKFDVRTVKVKNGTLVVDQKIGTQDHFSGDMKKLISSHCALESAVEGTGPAYKDKLTGLQTLCAFGTQEGTIILDESLKAYDALVNIFENEYELKVNKPGKGVRIQYENDYER